MSEPVPCSLTVSLNLGAGCRSKVAVTSLAADIVTRHLFSPLTEPQPVQEAGLEPAAGEPVSVTVVPSSNSAEHSPLEQLIPAGELVTVPEPVPCSLTRSEEHTAELQSHIDLVCRPLHDITRHL